MPPPVIYTAFDKHKAEEHVEHVRTTRESARNRQSKPSDPVVPDDLPGETKPDISEKEVFDVCGNFCQQNPQAMTAVMNIIEGANPEDDEQTLQQRVSNHLRIMGLNDAFGYGDWYTTRLDPSVSSAAARIVDYYFDRLRDSTAGLVATAAVEGNQSLSMEHVDPAVSEPESKFLNYHFMEHARKNIDGWSETWTSEAEFSDFLLTHWAETYGIQLPGEIVEAPLEVQLAEFSLFVGYHRESYFSATWQYESPYPEMILTKDYNDLLPLLALLNPAPLNDLGALLDVFGWVDEAGAVFVLRRRVEAVYSVQEEELPADWEHMSDAVEMAKMLYTGIEKLIARWQSDSTFLSSNDPATAEFGRQYDLFSSPAEDFPRLAGIDTSADNGLFMFVLSLWEPADYIITLPEIVEHIGNRELVQAVVNTGLLLTPGLSGKMDNTADLIRRIDAALNVPGVNWFVKRHDLAARAFSKQAVEEIMAGRATRPRWGAGHGKLHGPDKEYLKNASEITHREYDVGDFLAGELGYEVVYIWPDSPSSFVTHVHTSANYQGRGNPDFFIMHPGEDGQIVLREFDVYSPTTDNLGTIFNEIKDKVRERGTGDYTQADRIALDLGRVKGKIDLEDLERKLKSWNTDHLAVPLKEVMVITRSGENYHMKHVWIFN